MGQSKSITDLKQQNDEFNQYMTLATANLKSRAQPLEAEFNATVESFYTKNNWDQQPIGGGSNMDYRQASEFSLDSIQQSVQRVANAVFKGGVPPDGTLMDDAKAVAKVASEMASFEVLALTAATSFLTQLLGAFDTGLSTEFHSTVQSKSLAPGLMLHTWYFGDAFQKEDYFNNQFIIENAVNFKLIYSFAQAAMEQDIAYMEFHSKEIDKLEDLIDKMQEHLDELQLDPATSLSTIEDYQKRMEMSKQNMETYRNEVDSLVKKYRANS